ncbi:MAG: hypothetical protein FWE68_00455, partial [Defluviitaleaceae bacterium]|nr:hypothetical protein [Defluviitaleaceae bacterium]
EYVGNTGDIYEKNMLLQQRVREVYLNAAERLENMKVISCAEDGGLLSPEEISVRVRGALDNPTII